MHTHTHTHTQSVKEVHKKLLLLMLLRRGFVSLILPELVYGLCGVVCDPGSSRGGHALHCATPATGRRRNASRLDTGQQLPARVCVEAAVVSGDGVRSQNARTVHVHAE